MVTASLQRIRTQITTIIGAAILVIAHHFHSAYALGNPTRVPAGTRIAIVTRHLHAQLQAALADVAIAHRARAKALAHRALAACGLKADAASGAQALRHGPRRAATGADPGADVGQLDALLEHAALDRGGLGAGKARAAIDTGDTRRATEVAAGAVADTRRAGCSRRLALAGFGTRLAAQAKLAHADVDRIAAAQVERLAGQAAGASVDALFGAAFAVGQVETQADVAGLVVGARAARAAGASGGRSGVETS